MMRVGLDLDKTALEVPWMFSSFTKGLLHDGHEVHIMTYRDQNLLNYTKKQLDSLVIIYTKLHLPPNKDIGPEVWKRGIVESFSIDVVFDDQLSILGNMPRKVQVFWAGQSDNPDVKSCASFLGAYNEFRRLDDFLGLSFGTIASVVKHHILDRLPEVQMALSEYGVFISDCGYISRESREKWFALMKEAGMSEVWLYDYGFK